VLMRGFLDLKDWNLYIESLEDPDTDALTPASLGKSGLPAVDAPKSLPQLVYGPGRWAKLVSREDLDQMAEMDFANIHGGVFVEGRDPSDPYTLDTGDDSYQDHLNKAKQELKIYTADRQSRLKELQQGVAAGTIDAAAAQTEIQNIRQDLARAQNGIYRNAEGRLTIIHWGLSTAENRVEEILSNASAQLNIPKEELRRLTAEQIDELIRRKVLDNPAADLLRNVRQHDGLRDHVQPPAVPVQPADADAPAKPAAGDAKVDDYTTEAGFLIGSIEQAEMVLDQLKRENEKTKGLGVVEKYVNARIVQPYQLNPDGMTQMFGPETPNEQKIAATMARPSGYKYNSGLISASEMQRVQVGADGSFTLDGLAVQLNYQGLFELVRVLEGRNADADQLSTIREKMETARLAAAELAKTYLQFEERVKQQRAELARLRLDSIRSAVGIEGRAGAEITLGLDRFRKSEMNYVRAALANPIEGTLRDRDQRGNGQYFIFEPKREVGDGLVWQIHPISAVAGGDQGVVRKYSQTPEVLWPNYYGVDMEAERWEYRPSQPGEPGHMPWHWAVRAGFGQPAENGRAFPYSDYLRTHDMMTTRTASALSRQDVYRLREDGAWYRTTNQYVAIDPETYEVIEGYTDGLNSGAGHFAPNQIPYFKHQALQAANADQGAQPRLHVRVGDEIVAFATAGVETDTDGNLLRMWNDMDSVRAQEFLYSKKFQVSDPALLQHYQNLTRADKEALVQWRGGAYGMNPAYWDRIKTDYPKEYEHAVAMAGKVDGDIVYLPLWSEPRAFKLDAKTDQALVSMTYLGTANPVTGNPVELSPLSHHYNLRMQPTLYFDDDVMPRREAWARALRDGGIVVPNPKNPMSDRVVVPGRDVFDQAVADYKARQVELQVALRSETNPAKRAALTKALADLRQREFSVDSYQDAPVKWDGGTRDVELPSSNVVWGVLPARAKVIEGIDSLVARAKQGSPALEQLLDGMSPTEKLEIAELIAEEARSASPSQIDDILHGNAGDADVRALLAQWKPQGDAASGAVLNSADLAEATKRYEALKPDQIQDPQTRAEVWEKVRAEVATETAARDRAEKFAEELKSLLDSGALEGERSMQSKADIARAILADPALRTEAVQAQFVRLMNSCSSCVFEEAQKSPATGAFDAFIQAANALGIAPAQLIADESKDARQAARALAVIQNAAQNSVNPALAAQWQQIAARTEEQKLDPVKADDLDQPFRVLEHPMPALADQNLQLQLPEGGEAEPRLIVPNKLREDAREETVRETLDLSNSPYAEVLHQTDEVTAVLLTTPDKQQKIQVFQYGLLSYELTGALAVDGKPIREWIHDQWAADRTQAPSLKDHDLTARRITVHYTQRDLDPSAKVSEQAVLRKTSDLRYDRPVDVETFNPFVEREKAQSEDPGVRDASHITADRMEVWSMGGTRSAVGGLDGFSVLFEDSYKTFYDGQLFKRHGEIRSNERIVYSEDGHERYNWYDGRLVANPTRAALDLDPSLPSYAYNLPDRPTRDLLDGGKFRDPRDIELEALTAFRDQYQGGAVVRNAVGMPASVLTPLGSTQTVTLDDGRVDTFRMERKEDLRWFTAQDGRPYLMKRDGTPLTNAQMVLVMDHLLARTKGEVVVEGLKLLSEAQSTQMIRYYDSSGDPAAIATFDPETGAARITLIERDWAQSKTHEKVRRTFLGEGRVIGIGMNAAGKVDFVHPQDQVRTLRPDPQSLLDRDDANTELDPVHAADMFPVGFDTHGRAILRSNDKKYLPEEKNPSAVVTSDTFYDQHGNDLTHVIVSNGRGYLEIIKRDPTTQVDLGRVLFTFNPDGADPAKGIYPDLMPVGFSLRPETSDIATKPGTQLARYHQLTHFVDEDQAPDPADPAPQYRFRHKDGSPFTDDEMNRLRTADATGDAARGRDALLADAMAAESDRLSSDSGTLLKILAGGFTRDVVLDPYGRPKGEIVFGPTGQAIGYGRVNSIDSVTGNATVSNSTLLYLPEVKPDLDNRLTPVKENGQIKWYLVDKNTGEKKPYALGDQNQADTFDEWAAQFVTTPGNVTLGLVGEEVLKGSAATLQDSDTQEVIKYRDGFAVEVLATGKLEDGRSHITGVGRVVGQATQVDDWTVDAIQIRSENFKIDGDFYWAVNAAGEIKPVIPTFDSQNRPIRPDWAARGVWMVEDPKLGTIQIDSTADAKLKDIALVDANGKPAFKLMKSVEERFVDRSTGNLEFIRIGTTLIRVEHQDGVFYGMSAYAWDAKAGKVVRDDTPEKGKIILQAGVSVGTGKDTEGRNLIQIKGQEYRYKVTRQYDDTGKVIGATRVPYLQADGKPMALEFREDYRGGDLAGKQVGLGRQIANRVAGVETKRTAYNTDKADVWDYANPGQVRGEGVTEGYKNQGSTLVVRNTQFHYNDRTLTGTSSDQLFEEDETGRQTAIVNPVSGEATTILRYDGIKYGFRTERNGRVMHVGLITGYEPDGREIYSITNYLYDDQGRSKTFESTVVSRPDGSLDLSNAFDETTQFMNPQAAPTHLDTPGQVIRTTDGKVIKVHGGSSFKATVGDSKSGVGTVRMTAAQGEKDWLHTDRRDYRGMLMVRVDQKGATVFDPDQEFKTGRQRAVSRHDVHEDGTPTEKNKVATFEDGPVVDLPIPGAESGDYFTKIQKDLNGRTERVTAADFFGREQAVYFEKPSMVENVRAEGVAMVKTGATAQQLSEQTRAMLRLKGDEELQPLYYYGKDYKILETLTPKGYVVKTDRRVVGHEDWDVSVEVDAKGDLVDFKATDAMGYVRAIISPLPEGGYVIEIVAADDRVNDGKPDRVTYRARENQDVNFDVLESAIQTTYLTSTELDLSSKEARAAVLDSIGEVPPASRGDVTGKFNLGLDRIVSELGLEGTIHLLKTEVNLDGGGKSYAIRIKEDPYARVIIFWSSDTSDANLIVNTEWLEEYSKTGYEYSSTGAIFMLTSEPAILTPDEIVERHHLDEMRGEIARRGITLNKYTPLIAMHRSQLIEGDISKPILIQMRYQYQKDPLGRNYAVRENDDVVRFIKPSVPGAKDDKGNITPLTIAQGEVVVVGGSNNLVIRETVFSGVEVVNGENIHVFRPIYEFRNAKKNQQSQRKNRIQHPHRNRGRALSG
jgi:hypothetical protein